MAVGVGSGADGRVAGRGLGVGVVVVAVGEVGALVEEEAESAAFEVGAVALEIVFAELVDDQDNCELGMGVIGARRDDVAGSLLVGFSTWECLRLACAMSAVGAIRRGTGGLRQFVATGRRESRFARFTPFPC